VRAPSNEKKESLPKALFLVTLVTRLGLVIGLLAAFLAMRRKNPWVRAPSNEKKESLQKLSFLSR